MNGKDRSGVLSTLHDRVGNLKERQLIERRGNLLGVTTAGAMYLDQAIRDNASDHQVAPCGVCAISAKARNRFCANLASYGLYRAHGIQRIVAA
jgi:hypothetical protein